MGYSKASKSNTHARLVKTAAARFKERGVDGIGVADLMKELDLTHGGFYKHFASRDELVVEALQWALDESGAAMRARLFDGDTVDLAGFVNFYLAETHRDARAGGCAVAALSGDAARKSVAVQAQFHHQIGRNLTLLSEALSAGSADEDSRAQAIVLLSTLYGALTMARAVGDSALSNEILHTVRQHVLRANAAPPKPRSRARGNRAPTLSVDG